MKFNELLNECIELLGYRVSMICRIKKGEKGNIKAQAEYLRQIANKLDILAEFK